ncbi:hypothetical protein G4B88_003449 [Cannabis sativa]|uniref:Uncharacterized protein n=1 Tax=Cannabis sativa TaxID=3483 RepID=A0A7J6H3X2_CANSA|nr:hypothetical protein G4B88_003449 [Cannabis sativa]
MDTNFGLLLSIGNRSEKYHGGRASMPPSSSGLGHLSFKEAAGIRLPLGYQILKHAIYVRKNHKHQSYAKKSPWKYSNSWFDSRWCKSDGGIA